MELCTVSHPGPHVEQMELYPFGGQLIRRRPLHVLILAQI